MELKNNELDKILFNWFIKPSKHSIQNGGVVNHNWLIRNYDKKFILRETSQFKTFNAIKFEHNYLNYLKNSGFGYKIPILIKTKRNKNVVCYNKTFFWLYRYIDGELKDKLNSSEIKIVAEMMVDYHKIVYKHNFPKVRKSTTDPFFKAALTNNANNLIRNIKNKQKITKFDLEYLKILEVFLSTISKFDIENYKKLKTYPLHTDIKNDNLIWNKNELVGIIDFDNVGRLNDTIIKDLTHFIQFSCTNDINKHKIDFKKAKLFLDTYSNYLDLTKNEINFIPNIMMSCYMDYVIYMYWLLEHEPQKVNKNVMYAYFESFIWIKNNAEMIISYLS